MLTSSKLEEMAERLIARQQRLFVVEASAGGALQSALTSMPGASRWMLGGLNCYHDSIKTVVLGMSPEVLQQSGAVSEHCTQALAQHGLRLSGADWVLVETGVYGPDGGSPEKPVGLVYIGVASAQQQQIVRQQLSGDRMALRQQVADLAVQQMLAVLRA